MKSAFSRIFTTIILTQLLSACSSISYYAQGVQGHMALMSQRKPIVEVLQDKNLSAKRKEQIEQVLSIRKFASEILKLPKNNSYTSYVELKRDAISWNVVATPKYSVSPIKNCFPFTGCVSYLVYFSKARAQNAANKHKKLGHDTHIIASPAYSTLGFFDDPIVSTMFKGGTSSIAQVVFHELVHQKLFRKNDSAFNEAFASTVGEQGTRLWLKQYHPEKLKTYNDHQQKRWQFFNLLIAIRHELDAFYKSNIDKNKMEKGKQRIFSQLKQRYIRLKKSWGGDKRFDNWFNKHPLNNAKLAVIGVYYQKVPEFTRQLKAFDYDFEEFYRYYADNKDI